MNRRTLRRAVAGVLKEASSIRSSVNVTESKRNEATNSQNSSPDQASERRSIDSSRG